LPPAKAAKTVFPKGQLLQKRERPPATFIFLFKCSARWLKLKK